MDDQMPYAAAGSRLGRLQRGGGAGYRQAVLDRAVGDVMACVRRDWRWDWQVDQREEYLARLVRDLELPLAPIVRQLRDSPDPDDWRDTTNLFAFSSGILRNLALVDPEARAALRTYVHDGDYWLDVVDDLGYGWPGEYWRDLYDVVAERLTESDIGGLWLDGDPWRTWEADHPEFAARVADRRAELAERREPRGEREPTVEQLMAAVRDPDRGRGVKVRALQLLSRREVPPELLDLADSLTFLHGDEQWPMLTPWYGQAVDALGAAAVGHARGWIDHDNPSLSWLGHRTLAKYGDRCDLPVIFARVDRMIAEDDWCGHDALFDGVIRLGVAEDPGSPLARRAIDRLRFLWESTPHSRERVDQLRALIAFGAAGPYLAEALWDCEDAVRVLAAETAPLTPLVETRLDELRADPLEADEVRAAASVRFG